MEALLFRLFDWILGGDKLFATDREEEQSYE